MSHQRFPSQDPVKEPHSISLKVLRLSRPSLVAQHPLPPSVSVPTQTTSTSTSTIVRPPPIPASLAFTSSHVTNPEPFILSPILNLPPSFGSAYVGETFSCTLCANHEAVDSSAATPAGQQLALATPRPPGGHVKHARDVRIEAEMKTPGSQAPVRLDLVPAPAAPAAAASSVPPGTDLEPGQTLQKVVNFSLKEEGNHVLSVTVTYYEATETSGRTRTFRKLYQFICKASLIVRTKAGPLPPAKRTAKKGEGEGERRRWVLEAQLENCSEDAIQLQQVVLEPESGLAYRACNWEVSGGAKPLLHPGEVEQVCFVVEEVEAGEKGAQEQDGRILLGVLGVGWRSEMGNRGYLSTGKLGTRHVK